MGDNFCVYFRPLTTHEPRGRRPVDHKQKRPRATGTNNPSQGNKPHGSHHQENASASVICINDEAFQMKVD
jgi:hypothetical protein